MKNTLNLVAVCTFLFLCSRVIAQIDYSQTESNVSYSQVTGLEYSLPNEELNYGEDQFQFGRLWLSSKPTENLVIFLHGGCWLNQFDMQHTYPLATALAQSGFNVWSLEYRRTGDAGGGWPGSYEDVKAGVEYLTELSDYGLSLEKSIIVGHSAGGHLALLAGREFPGLRATIGLAAITDIIAYGQGDNSCEVATPDFMGGTFDEIPARYRAANPANLTLHRSTILLHGDADNIVNIEQASIEGSRTELEPDAGHFDWVHPGTSAFQRLLDTLERLF